MTAPSGEPPAPATQPLDAAQVQAMTRENLYLRQRVALLESDVTALAAESDRLRQTLERLHGRVALRRPDPLAGGQ